LAEFEDESGIGVMPRAGTTWGKRGETPVIEASTQRGGYNALSVVTPDGTRRYSLKDGTIDEKVFVGFLKQVIGPRQRLLILLMDHAKFHGSRAVRQYVRQHREKLRVFFLPKRAPELNPDEQVWNEVKNNGIGKQPVKDKADLETRLYSMFASLQKRAKRVMSFFKLPDTECAGQALPCES
jgi:transposase